MLSRRDFQRQDHLAEVVDPMPSHTRAANVFFDEAREFGVAGDVVGLDGGDRGGASGVDGGLTVYALARAVV